MSSTAAGKNGALMREAQFQPGLVAALNELIAMCHNGEKGYRLAGDRVDSELLRELFGAYAQQRGDFARLLQQEVARRGNTPESGGDLAGTLHRLWMRVKRAFSTDAAIVDECLSGDAAALEVYEEVRRGLAAGPVEDLVEQQYEAIRAARDRLLALQATRRFDRNEKLDRS